MTNTIDKLKEKTATNAKPATTPPELDEKTCTKHLCTTCHSHHDSSDVTICPRAIKYERIAERWGSEFILIKCQQYEA